MGGRGAGKSFIGAYDLITRAKPRRLYIAAAPTYKIMRDASLRSFLENAEKLRALEDMNLSDMQATLTNGAQVLFRSGHDPDNLRGPNLSGVWLDEASQMHRKAYEVVIACLRQAGEMGWLSATFTPRGLSHWTYEVFASGRENTQLIKARTLENPFLAAEFYDTIKAQYSSMLAAQELEGEFIEGYGLLFRRHWFEIVDAVPPLVGPTIRAWDFAATEPKEGKDPDYTAGVRIGRSSSGTFYILDIRRVRATPLAVEFLVKQTAELDGKDTHILLEQEPGASGQALVDRYIRTLLPGYTVRAEKPTGDKVARAMPFSSQCEAGNVKLLRGAWNKDFLDEVEVFPSGDHDDQVDAASEGFTKLAAGKRRLAVFL